MSYVGEVFDSNDNRIIWSSPFQTAKMAGYWCDYQRDKYPYAARTSIRETDAAPEILICSANRDHYRVRGEICDACKREQGGPVAVTGS